MRFLGTTRAPLGPWTHMGAHRDTSSDILTNSSSTSSQRPQLVGDLPTGSWAPAQVASWSGSPATGFQVWLPLSP